MNRSIIIATLFCFTLVLLNIFGFFFPGSLNWGFHTLGFLHPVVLVVYGVVSLFLIAFTFSEISKRWIASVANLMENNPKQFLAGSLLLFISVSYLLRVKTPLLGDGIFLMKNFSEAMKDSSSLFLRNEPLASLYYFVVMKLFGSPTYESFLLSFWIAGIIAGIGFIISAFYFAKTIFEQPRTRMLTFFFLCSGAYMQLFLGYVETYGIVMMWLMVYSLLSVLYLKEKISFLWLPVCFLLQVVTHYISFIMLPALFYTAYVEIKSKGGFKVFTGIAIILTGIFLMLWLADFNIARLTAYVPHKHYLSFSQSNETAEAYSQAYTVFSPFHLLDIVNLILLVSPVSVVLLVAGLVKERSLLSKERHFIFLLASCIPVFLVMVFLKYDLGAAKDWDVAAVYFPLLAAFGCTLLLYRPKEHTITIATLLLGITILNSLLWFSLNATTEPAIQRLRALLDKRTISHLGYYAASMHLSSYFHQTGENARSVDLWKEYSTAFPNDPNGYRNTLLNIKLVDAKNYDAMSATYEEWLHSGGNDLTMKAEYAKLCMNAGTYYLQHEEFEKAKSFYTKAKLITPFSAEIYNNLGSVYAYQESTALALEHFRTAIMLDSLYSEPYFNMGTMLLESGAHDQAQECIQKAHELGNPYAKEFIEEQDSIPEPHLLL